MTWTKADLDPPSADGRGRPVRAAVGTQAGAWQRLGHRPALDGLRGLAVVLVVSYHAFPQWVPGGWLGVDIFFVLSGFLITCLLLGEVQRTQRVDLRRFYLRRTARLVPALLVFGLAYGVLALVTKQGEERAQVLWSLLRALTYTANVVADPESTHGLGHMWSLSMEEQFYLLWPVLLIVVLLRRGATALLCVTALLAVAVVVHRTSMSVDGADIARLYYWPDTRADALLLGCLAAQVFTRWGHRRGPWSSWLGAVAMVGLLGVSFTTPLTSPALYVWGLTALAVLAGTVILCLVHNPQTRTARFFSTTPCRWAGLLSYSLYLWHLPIILFVTGDDVSAEPGRAAAGVGLAVIAAVVSYTVVERPFQAWRNRTSPGS